MKFGGMILYTNNFKWRSMKENIGSFNWPKNFKEIYHLFAILYDYSDFCTGNNYFFEVLFHSNKKIHF